MPSTVLSIILGCFLIGTAAMKAFFSRLFIIHVRKLKFLPDQPASLAAIILIEFEAGLGMALVTGVFSYYVVPATFLLLVFITLLTWRGLYHRQIDDCGCYGAFLTLSVGKTTAINGLCLIALGVIWFQGQMTPYAEKGGIWIIIAVILLTHLAARKSVVQPLFDFLQLQKGKRWNSGTISLDVNLGENTKELFFFMNKNCPVCRNWLVRIGQHAPTGKTIPMTILLPEESSVDLEELNGVKGFCSVKYLKPVIFKLLTGRVPMGVLVEQGSINEQWIHSFPEEVFDIKGTYP
jgi:methylamine utilization protein MauE